MDPAHHIWGAPEPLHDDTSCSNSSSRASTLREGAAHQKYPIDVQEHLEQDVIYHEESNSSAGQSLASFPGKDYLSDDNFVPSESSPYRSQVQQAPYRGDHLASGSQDLGFMAGELSAGSERHPYGDCKPCLYFNSKAGCLNGKGCRFCHFLHTKKNRPRPCKAKRTQCKQIVNMLYTAFDENSYEFQEASLRLSSESSYMRSILGGAQRNNRSHPGEFNAGYSPSSSTAVRPAVPDDGSARPVSQGETFGETVPVGWKHPQAAAIAAQHGLPLSRSNLAPARPVGPVGPTMRQLQSL